MPAREPAISRLMLVLGLGTTLLTPTTGTLPADTPLTAAAADDDAEQLAMYLAAGLNPDAPDGDGLTPVIWAAREGHLNALDALLQAGADPNLADTHHGWTPLMHAAAREQTAAARTLLAAGAIVNASAPNGLTPLLIAAAGEDATLVEMLLVHGADPRVSGPDGETPLSQALSGGAFSALGRPVLGTCHPAIVRLLLARDGSLRLPRNFSGAMARCTARMSGCADVLELIGD